MKVFVCGHTGMVGSSVLRKLLTGKADYAVVTADREQLDLTNQKAVSEFFKAMQLDCVILCAAKVGGIVANSTYPADFICTNLKIQGNVIESCYEHGVKKLIFLGSSCIYPRDAQVPIAESALMSGPLEKTNDAYAIAKIAGLKLCESYRVQYDCDFRALMPTNLFGLNDFYHRNDSHVIPALFLKFHEAKIGRLPYVNLIGTGKAQREFLYADDLSDFIIKIIELDKGVWDEQVNKALGCNHVNVGSGDEISIRSLANQIALVVGYSGDIRFESSDLDGTPRKVLDSRVARSFNWEPKVAIKDGLLRVYEDFLDCKVRSSLRC